MPAMNALLQSQYAVTRFSDVVTGRIAHWNKTNLVASREIRANLDKLTPFAKEVFTWFHAGAVAAVKMLLLERRIFRAPLLRVDTKTLAVDNFRGLYLVIITYYTHIFSMSNSDVADDVRDALYQIVSNRNEAASILDRLRTEESREGDRPRQFSQIEQQMFVWEKAAEALSITDYKNIALWNRFNGVALEWYAFAIENIVKRVAHA